MWRVMRINDWKDITNLRIKQLSNYTKSQRHAWMIINLKKKKMDQSENYLLFAHKSFRNVFHWHVLGGLIFLWSVTKLARAVSKWTKACGKRLARLISYIHHTSGWKQYCYVGNTAQQSKIRLFQDSVFARDLEDSISTSGGLLCWMCKKQISVSHSSTEAELISLDASLRMDEIPALGLWDLVIEVFHFSPTQSKEAKDQARRNSLRDTTSNKDTQNQTEDPTKHDNFDLSDVAHVPSNAKFSRFGAMLYIFDDNEAVIKNDHQRPKSHNETCIKNPQSCAWLVVRSNQYGPQIHIKYTDTQKPTRRHTDKGKFHTWRTESSFVFV